MKQGVPSRDPVTTRVRPALRLASCTPAGTRFAGVTLPCGHIGGKGGIASATACTATRIEQIEKLVTHVSIRSVRTSLGCTLLLCPQGLADAGGPNVSLLEEMRERAAALEAIIATLPEEDHRALRRVTSFSAAERVTFASALGRALLTDVLHVHEVLALVSILHGWEDVPLGIRLAVMRLLRAIAGGVTLGAVPESSPSERASRAPAVPPTTQA